MIDVERESEPCFMTHALLVSFADFGRKGEERRLWKKKKAKRHKEWDSVGVQQQASQVGAHTTCDSCDQDPPSAYSTGARTGKRTRSIS